MTGRFAAGSTNSAGGKTWMNHRPHPLADRIAPSSNHLLRAASRPSNRGTPLKPLMMGDTSNKQKTPAKPRSWAVPILVGLVAAGLAVFFAYNQNATVQISQDDYAARTEMVLRTTPLIDGHNDLPFLLRLELHNQIYDNKSFPFRESE